MLTVNQLVVAIKKSLQKVYSSEVYIFVPRILFYSIRIEFRKNLGENYSGVGTKAVLVYL